MVSPRLSVIAVVGPTATGKSSFAEALAREFEGEVVSADSMQVYKGMDIGTAKVPASERQVPYHCLDLVAPDEPFDAFKYQQAARDAIEDIYARGKRPVVCGGTGLYIRAALEHFVPGERAEAESSQKRADATDKQDSEASDELTMRAPRRERLNAEAAALGAEAFYAKLDAVDPESAALIHPHNTRRVVRAFEWLEEGSSYAEQAARFDVHNEVYSSVYLGLNIPREELYARIDARVEQMIEQGLLDEVRDLLDKGYEQAITAQQAIGYKELVRVLKGTESLETAVAQIQQATRRYAKRQQTWFKRDKRIHWLDARKPLDELLEVASPFIAG